ncbi:MAG: caspase family protein, partial [Deltaproteobacteria bacterium]|nr:caspase family protein [Deltaproteobacteria bacterium]
MTRRLWLGFFAAALATAMLLPAGGAWAARSALLIGVGDYAHPSIPDLEGPPHDVEALARLLTGVWEVSPQRLTVLKDSQATRDNILKVLENLTRTTKPGDFVFVYFSGHGTSVHSGGFESLDPHTGALLPHDFQPGSQAQMISAVIVGKRDLRPIMARLDRDRQVLAVFDACYSGNAIRAVGLQGAPRFYAPRAVQDLTGGQPLKFGSQTRNEPPYPYQKVIYISASSQREVARDIGHWLISTGKKKTVDGRP